MMQDQPIVSVVIPCLDRAHLLRPTIESVLGQDYPLIECIVVDGGSTDGTIDILKSYGNRIRWVSEADQSQADAINKGWQMGKGEILAWLNADDIWVVPDAVSKVVAFLREHPDVDVVYGKCGMIDALGKPIGMFYMHEWDLQYAIEYHDQCLPQPASFVRRRILDKVGFLDTSVFAMDKELWFRIGLHGKIAHLAALVAYARDTPGKTWDGLALAEDCERVARMFYARPDIPPKLLEIERRAMSNAYVQAASLAYGRGANWKKATEYLLRALMEDPTNIGRIVWRVCRAGLFLMLGRTRFVRFPV